MILKGTAAGKGSRAGPASAGRQGARACAGSAAGALALGANAAAEEVLAAVVPKAR